MSPTRNGHNPSNNNSSNSSSTGTIPKIQTRGQAQSGRPLLPQSFLHNSTLEFSLPSNPLAEANDLDQARLNHSGQMDLEELAEQNLFLRRMHDQQENLLDQVDMTRWQEATNAEAIEKMVASTSNVREREQRRDLVDVLDRLEQVPHPQQITESIAQLQQKITYLRLLGADSSNRGSKTALETLMAEKSTLMKKLAHLEAKRQQMGIIAKQHLSLTTGDMHIKQRQSDSQSEEISYLKDRLRELQQQAHAMEATSGPPKCMPRISQLNATDHLLAEMQEQLKLQKDLHLRRKELEELMKKDLLENMHKNEIENSRQNLSDSKSDVSSHVEWFMEALPANHYQTRSRQMSLSSNMSNMGAETQTDKQLQLLQSQIENLQCEIRRLNMSVSQPNVAPSQNERRVDSATSHNAGGHQLVLYYQQQQQQIQQLNNSVNQCMQALLDVQRDVSCLQWAVEKLLRQNESSSVNMRSPTSPLSRPLGSVDAQNQGLDPWHVPDVDFGTGLPDIFREDSWRHSADAWPFSSEQGMPPLSVNSLDHHLNDTSERLTSGVTLNNQVPPGMRANNYWDNFRSFSRQNRLFNVSSSFPTCSSLPSSSAPAPSVPTISSAPGPNVAQVTPRQLQSTPQSFSMEPPRRVPVRQALIEPNFVSIHSPPRPRRKQKINREQNLEIGNEHPSGRIEQQVATAAAMVFPMPQNQDRNVNHEVDPRPVNLATVNPIVSSLTRSIYNQINNLINQNEERPDHLAKIFHNLQSLDNDLLSNRNRLDQNPNGMAVQNHREAVASMMRTPLELQNCEYVLPHNTSKLRTDKRFSSLRTEDESRSSPLSRPTVLVDQRHIDQFPSIHNSLRIISTHGQGDQVQEMITPFAQRHSSDEASSLRCRASGAVPKNVQRNLKESREEGQVLYMQQMPKNMQDHCLPDSELLISSNITQDFLNVNARFSQATHESDEAAHYDVKQQGEEEVNINTDEEESEIPEADQGHSPDHSTQSSGASCNTDKSVGRRREEEIEDHCLLASVEAEGNSDGGMASGTSDLVGPKEEYRGSRITPGVSEQQLQHEEATMRNPIHGNYGIDELPAMSEDGSPERKHAEQPH